MKKKAFWSAFRIQFYSYISKVREKSWRLREALLKWSPNEFKWNSPLPIKATWIIVKFITACKEDLTITEEYIKK